MKPRETVSGEAAGLARVPARVGSLRIHPVGDGYVVEQAETGRIHHLNQTAALLLELSEGRATAGEIVALVGKVYSLEREQALTLAAALDDLASRGLVAWATARPRATAAAAHRATSASITPRRSGARGVAPRPRRGAGR